MSLTIYCLLTPLGYKQTAVNAPPPPPKWRRSTYYFIYIAIYPEGKQFPVGVGWGGLLLLLLLFLNNFCYSCIENLKGKRGGGGEKAICCQVPSGNYWRAPARAGWAPGAPGRGAARHHTGTRQGCTKPPSPGPGEGRAVSPAQRPGKASQDLTSCYSNPFMLLS